MREGIVTGSVVTKRCLASHVMYNIATIPLAHKVYHPDSLNMVKVNYAVNEQFLWI